MENSALVKQVQNVEEGHILQNPRDRLAVKIAKWRGENITAQEQKSLDYNKNRYFDTFKCLSDSLEGLSPILILKLDREELLTLEEYLYERALKKYKRFIYLWQPFLLPCIHIFGWIALGVRYNQYPSEFSSCKFVTSRRKLEKLLGKNFFPQLADEFIAYLKQS